MNMNFDSINIYAISKNKTQMMVSLNPLKNLVSQVKRLKNLKKLKQILSAKRIFQLESSKSVKKQKSHEQIILSLT